MAGKLLCIVIDQLRADCVYGALAGAVGMENLRALMRESVTFNNHHTVVTPCGPSRASLLTGLYAMNHRSIRNGTPLKEHFPTLPRALRTAGYEPLLFGYTDTSADPEGRHPRDPDLRTYEGLAPGFAEIVRMRYETSGSWQADLKAKGYVLPKEVMDIYRPVPPSPGARAAISDPALYRAQDSDTAFLTDQTIRELSVREGEDWFSMVTYIRPHPPFVAPEPFNKMYVTAEKPPPIRPFRVDEQKKQHPFFDAFFAEPSNFGLYIGFDGNLDALSPTDVEELRAVYFGLASEVDAHIGRLLEYLKASGQYDDTLIVVTADHGEMLGDYHLWGKNSPYEGALKIPLIIRDPRNEGAAGEIVSAFTESVDIMPTLLEWAGARLPLGLDGRSLLPFLEGRAPEDWRSHSFAEIDLGDPLTPTRFQHRFVLPMEQCNYAILQDHDFKLVYFNGGLQPMLFDRQEDPQETRDLARDPAYAAVLERMIRKMLDHRMTYARSDVTRSQITDEGLLHG